MPFRSLALLIAAWLFLGTRLAAAANVDSRGKSFVGVTEFSRFERENGRLKDDTILTSPVIEAAVPFNEVVVSWNVDAPADSRMTVETRVFGDEWTTRYYTMGCWTPKAGVYQRRSQRDQDDKDGRVSTDTLVLKRPARRFQLRLSFGGELVSGHGLKFIGVSLTDSSLKPAELPPGRAAWNTLIPVPERSQMAYPNGKVLCSPTTVSMLLGYWSNYLKRPELDRPVPEIADAVYDSEWKGAGNWVFNMAYAGTFSGMRAYVTRLSDVSELESWIARSIPVGLSVDYDRLRAKGPGPNGHLVVCAGFTADGDPIINDPGTSKSVRKIFSRKNLIDAWACSHNTVYLIYPEEFVTPEDAFGHWDSGGTRVLQAASNKR